MPIKSYNLLDMQTYMFIFSSPILWTLTQSMVMGGSVQELFFFFWLNESLEQQIEKADSTTTVRHTMTYNVNSS